MNYEQAITYIDNITGISAKVGLVRIKRILGKLGNPQNDLKIIHVAGTNGKGSVCAMLTNILMQMGNVVGLYTSPHLKCYNERYQINFTMISNEKFANYMELIKQNCDEMVKDGEGQPTVFEVLTCLAFLYFAEKKVDYVVLEVGLGGRFDATNVIENPILSVITFIGKDHIEYLGDDLKQIAAEKGGIIKHNCPVVLSSQNESVYCVIKQICEEKRAELYYTQQNYIKVLSQKLDKTIFSIKNEFLEYESIELPLLGSYQIQNCATVLLACKMLIDKGVSLNEKGIIEGIKTTYWAGRMELCGKNPLLFVDGAHNYDGICALKETIQNYFKDKKITFIVGVLKDKEYEKMMDSILPFVHKIIITEPDSKRKLNADSLKNLIVCYDKPVYEYKEIKEALKYAKEITDEKDVICCAGSLYMVGKIKELLEDQKIWEEF